MSTEVTEVSAATDPADDVPEVRPPSLSPSRASDFMTCPLLYRFRVIDRLPERPSPAATRGTMVHAVLERLFDLPAIERVPARAHAMIAPEWERLLEAEPELAALFDDDEGRDEWLTSAAGLLDSYFALEDPTVLEPAERELFVECDLESGLRLRGYVDRLDEAPGGALRVVDYKTGRAPREGFEAKAMFQMRFYALVLWRLRGEVPRLLQLLYLGSGEVLRYEPDEADLRATERKVLALWDAIARATEQGDWRPSPSKLCDWCDHQALCPAFGGTPPELPVLPVPAVHLALAADERPSPHTPGDEV
jgi:putative RecB family exonuclease